MNKLLLSLSAVVLSLGMLGAAACSGCSPSNTNNSNSSVMQQQSMHCGAYTHRVGNQCVGDRRNSGTSAQSSQPATLTNSSGN